MIALLACSAYLQNPGEDKKNSWRPFREKGVGENAGLPVLINVLLAMKTLGTMAARTFEAHGRLRPWSLASADAASEELPFEQWCDSGH